MKQLLELIPNLHNWLSDRDFIWWPFSFLRPEPKVLMTFKHVMLMTACFGGLAFLMFIGFSVVNNMLTADSILSTLFVCFGGFGAWFICVTKPLWNYRARKLQKKA